MTSYVLALMMALQVGQAGVPDIPLCTAPEKGWDTTCGAMMKFCRLFSPRPRPSDLMPLVEPLPPNSYLFVSNWDLRQRDPLVVPAIKEERLTHHKGDSCPAFGSSYCSYGNDEYELRWTCADKTNVLQVSEDGSGHWCVRF